LDGDDAGSPSTTRLVSKGESDDVRRHGMVIGIEGAGL
jgi:hypothetical protein